MNIHEYQAKKILSDFNVPVLKGILVESAAAIIPAAETLGGDSWVIKAQVHAGGRGKAGGIKVARSWEELETKARQILGMKIVSQQTGSSGRMVRKIYLEETASIEKEYYLGIVLDRGLEMPVLIASTEGGMEIEQVAASSPEKIIKIRIDPLIGFQPYHARELGFGLGLQKEQRQQLGVIARALYQIYRQMDASLIEINPLVETKEGNFIALDAKMGFDDNALFRHPDILDLRDMDEEEPAELEAGIYGLNYVKLEGNVGCMVNGAGLAMSTMDIIKYEGGEPANFLDVGGGASAESVAQGFSIILRDPNVKAIFVNIFGGIVRCDRIANGIIDATTSTQVKVPVIVRLDGTNSQEAAGILKQANIRNLITATDLAEGARLAVQAARGCKQ